MRPGRITVYALLVLTAGLLLLAYSLRREGGFLAELEELLSWETSRPPSSAEPAASSGAAPTPRERMAVDLAVFPEDPLRLFLNPDCQVVTPAIAQTGVWESTETHWILENIEEGDIFLDIGANVGYYTVIAARVVGDTGRVYAFEPDPASFAFLDRNVRLNGFQNVTLELKAASDQNGAIKLYLDDRNKGDHRIYQTEKERPSVDIEAVALDDYFRDDVGRIDFVKIDTQGAEMLILQGMQGIMRSNENVRMAVEFWPHGLSGLGGTAEGLLEILESHDFLFFDLGPGSGREVRLDLPVVEKAQLLEAHTVENRSFTNLLVTKGRREYKELTETLARKAEALEGGTERSEEERSEYDEALAALEEFKAAATSKKRTQSL
jgi:FkbM family methyltransferase